MNDVVAPGEYIKEEMAARGWSQADLAEILGRPLSSVSRIITGKHRITPYTAQGLAAAFGTSAMYWLSLDNAYRLWKARNERR